MASNKPKTKEFTVMYFAVDSSVQNDLENDLYDQTLTSKIINRQNNLFYISFCHEKNNIAIFCLRKVRTDNIPYKIDMTNQKEEDLKLRDKQGLSEKAYFAYKDGYIAFQCNGNVCRGESFPGIVREIFKKPCISPVALNRGVLSTDTIVKFDVGISHRLSDSPTDLQSNSIDGRLEEIRKDLNLPPEQKLKLSASIPSEQGENGNIFHKIQERFNMTGRVTVMAKGDEAEEAGYLILNLAGTIKSTTIEVNMNGRYPNEQDIATKLRMCMNI